MGIKLFAILVMQSCIVEFTDTEGENLRDDIPQPYEKRQGRISDYELFPEIKLGIKLISIVL